MKINKKYAGVLTALIMSTLMATVMSFALTLIKVGFDSSLLKAFAVTWMNAICVALPSGLILMPVVKSIVGRITE